MSKQGRPSLCALPLVGLLALVLGACSAVSGAGKGANDALNSGCLLCLPFTVPVGAVAGSIESVGGGYRSLNDYPLDIGPVEPFGPIPGGELFVELPLVGGGSSGAYQSGKELKPNGRFTKPTAKLMIVKSSDSISADTASTVHLEGDVDCGPETLSIRQMGFGNSSGEYIKQDFSPEVQVWNHPSHKVWEKAVSALCLGSMG